MWLFFIETFFIAITCKHLRHFKWKVSKREWKRWNTGVKISYEREAIVIALSHAYSWKINKAIYVKKVLKTLSKKNLGLHLECLYTHILLVRAFKCSQQIKWRQSQQFCTGKWFTFAISIYSILQTPTMHTTDYYMCVVLRVNYIIFVYITVIDIVYTMHIPLY